MPQLLTKAWCAENPERYRELAQSPAECPICIEAFTEDRPALSPILGDRASSCRHWACSECWLSVMDDHPANWRCPWCREGLQEWLGETLADFGYCPPPDAVGGEEIRHFASEALRRVPLPSDLEQLARRILRHVRAE